MRARIILMAVMLSALVGAIGTAVFITDQPVSADDNHAGLNFWISIDINGDTVPDCSTETGSAVCGVPANSDFDVSFNIGALPGDLSSGYEAYETTLTYPFISQDTITHVWPECNVPVVSYGDGETSFGCLTAVIPPLPDSTYTGVLARIGLTCGASNAGTVSIDHDHATIPTRVYTDDGAVTHTETTSGEETLHVMCGGAQQVAAGAEHTCALGGGRVACWGDNSFGQLGNDSVGLSSVPVPVCSTAGCASGVLTSVAGIAAGDYHTCAVLTNGEARCWGKNLNGQLGDNNGGVNSDIPVAVCADAGCSGNLGGVTGAAAGSEHTCVLGSAGGVRCWGDNSFGQLGDNNEPTDSDTPVVVCDAPACSGSLSTAAQLSVGGNHNCVRISGLTALCWGSNSQGQLGIGSTGGTQDTPDADVCSVSGCGGGDLGGVTWVGLGDEHSCAVTGGTIKCWGDNNEGQLGDGNAPTDSNLPVAVCANTTCTSSLTSVLLAGGGGAHTCVTVSDVYGVSAKCWGDNSQGQLSDGNAPTDSDTPRNVCDDPDCSAPVTDLTAGGGTLGAAHGCAIRTNGNVACAGDNNFGQLGDGNSPTDSDTGVGVAGLSAAPAPIATPTVTPTPVPPPQTVAGGGGGCTANMTPPYDGCLGSEAILDGPTGIFDTGPELYIADTEHHRVRVVDGSGVIDTVAGTGTAGDGGSSTATLAALNRPHDVFVAGGFLYIADTDNCRIRRVDLSTGGITSIAGTGPSNCGYAGDGGAATGAKLNKPRGVAVDAAGNIYIADTENCRIRKITGGTITTIAGTGSCAYFNDNGPATNAALNRPHDVFPLNAENDLVIADTSNNRIRRYDQATGVLSTLAGTGTAGFGGDGGAATSATLRAPEAVTVFGNLVLVADTGNDRIREVDLLTGKIRTILGGGVGGAGEVAGAGDTVQVAGTGELSDPAGVAADPNDGTIDVTNRELDQAYTADIIGGSPEGNFTPATSCGITPRVSSIDLLLPAAVLGMILARRRIRLWFFRLVAVASRGTA